jgi:hypothetical protein
VPSAPSKESTGQRARARSKPDAKAPKKRERVKHLIRMMRENRYVRHLTIDELAAEWGLSPRTVEDDVSAAARSFEEDDDEKRLGKALWLEQIRSAAQRADGASQGHVVARLLELEGKAKGYFEPQKVEISGSLGQLLSLATGSGGEDPEEPVGE